MQARIFHRSRAGTRGRPPGPLGPVLLGLFLGIPGAAEIQNVPAACVGRHAGIETTARGNMAEPAQGIGRRHGDPVAAGEGLALPKPAGPESPATRMPRQCQPGPLGVPSALVPAPPETASAGQQTTTTGNHPHAECAACHPHGESYDPTVARDTPDTPVRRRIQDRSRNGGATPGEVQDGRSGIPPETCFRCHFDPRLAGTNGIGDAYVHYGARHGGTGNGLLCQDCHTTADMHAAAGTEVRCEDCHGTPGRFPWELPLGFDGPNGNAARPPRGAAVRPEAAGGKSAARDGYLLTSRGNPFGNVVRDGDRVWLHSVTGAVHEVTQLKRLNEQGSWRSQLSRQIKSAPGLHGNMACLDCHADWLPPCLGCHGEPGAGPAGGARRSGK